MARDYGKADRLRIAREQRDAVARAAHEAALGAAPHERRVLVRAGDGELVSYTREEYGVGKSGLGPTIRTWQGYAVAVAVISGLLVWLVVAVVADHVDPPPDPPWWFLPVMLGMGVPLLLLFVHYCRKERRADRLRRTRGLPRPSQ